uniref:Uncharacterized protein n=1 Tax=Timema cristinae TaxID=61476 RepID=A0A7R9H2H4_TIMCR|nr:unnamed protein product [Timema cristinae]
MMVRNVLKFRALRGEGGQGSKASKLKTVNMEDNLDISSSKKEEMQLDPEYFVKDKIKIEPMVEFNSIKYFDGAVKSEIQEIFEPSSQSGSPSEELEEIEFVNMNIKLEVPEPSNDCVLPSTREENEMNLNSTISEVDIFEPSSHCGFLFIKEEHEEESKSEGESIADWAARAQNLAETCSLGTSLESNILD